MLHLMNLMPQEEILNEEGPNVLHVPIIIDNSDCRINREKAVKGVMKNSKKRKVKKHLGPKRLSQIGK